MANARTQMRLVRALREFLLGDSSSVLSANNQPKPDFPRGISAVPLPRCAPEAQGLSSAQMDQFYRRVASTPAANAHGLLVLRGGHVVAEGYFAPYRPDIWHVSHSLCKSVVGLAVGMAIEEGLFGLDDIVAGYFPKEAGLISFKAHRGITVRQLLTMRSGISFSEVSGAIENDWLHGIFSSSMDSQPDEKFTYNSINSYLLSALICRTSGQSLVDYLTPRLFEPMGFGPVAWEKSPEGIEKGGWGMYLTIEDMAKLGQLCLQHGRWQTPQGERQLVPKAWLLQAKTKQTDTDRDIGYGFHFWVDESWGSYSMNGMFGQYVTVLPQQNMVIAMTAGCPKLFADSAAYRQFHEAFADLRQLPQSLPANPGGYAGLLHTLSGLQFRRPAPELMRPAEAAPRPISRTLRWSLPRRNNFHAGIPEGMLRFCDTAYTFSRNRAGLLPIVIQGMSNNFTAGLKALCLRRRKDGITLFWEEDHGTLALPLGLERPLERIIHVGPESFVVACSASLRPNEDGENVLLVEICFLEHSSFRLIKLSLNDDNKLLVRMDEQPQILSTIEGAIKTGIASENASGKTTLGDFLNGDMLAYQLAQICAPTLTGNAVEP